MRNVGLLEATMQHILDHPESHYQGWWYRETGCGTVACFAGWACLLSGVVLRQGVTPVFLLAKDLLGLTPTEAASLFDPGNTQAMLQMMVKDLVNGEQLANPDACLVH